MPDVHIILAAPNKKKIKPLLQSEGLVIGVDGGAKIAIEESITLDVALGDFDSVDEEEYLAIKKEVGLIYSFSSEKDDTDAELALLYVLDNVEANNIYFYNWHGGRVDHLQSILMIVLQERFYSIVPRIHFISENNVISHYLPGEYKIDQKENMDYLSFILLTKVKRLTIKNAKYSIENKDYDLPRALVSNEFINGAVTISFNEGIVSVIQAQENH